MLCLKSVQTQLVQYCLKKSQLVCNWRYGADNMKGAGEAARCAAPRVRSKKLRRKMKYFGGAKWSPEGQLVCNWRYGADNMKGAGEAARCAAPRVRSKKLRRKMKYCGGAKWSP